MQRCNHIDISAICGLISQLTVGISLRLDRYTHKSDCNIRGHEAAPAPTQQIEATFVPAGAGGSPRFGTENPVGGLLQRSVLKMYVSGMSPFYTYTS